MPSRETRWNMGVFSQNSWRGADSLFLFLLPAGNCVRHLRPARLDSARTRPCESLPVIRRGLSGGSRRERSLNIMLMDFSLVTHSAVSPIRRVFKQWPPLREQILLLELQETCTLIMYSKERYFNPSKARLAERDIHSEKDPIPAKRTD